MKRKAADDATAIMRGIAAGADVAFEVPTVGTSDDAVAEAVAEYTAATIRKHLRARVDNLSTLKRVEGGTSESGGDGPSVPIRYLGVWKEHGGYGVGAIVTHDGVLWHCDAPTSSRPPGPEWTLMHKSISRR